MRQYCPVKIGDHVFVDQGSTIEAASIGNYVRIGQRVKVQNLCIIKDCVLVEDDTVLPPNTVIPPYTHVKAGRPPQSIVMAELPESTQDILDGHAYYDAFDML